MLDHEVSFEDIWTDPNYNSMGLPDAMSIFALVHPNDLHIVYFFQKERLFGFNLQMKTVTDCQPNDIDTDEASSGFLLPWVLPKSLEISPGLFSCPNCDSVG